VIKQIKKKTKLTKKTNVSDPLFLKKVAPNKKTVLKKIRVGTVCEFKITALGLNNIGIDDRSKKYSVLIPNAKFGQIVKAKIVKINLKQNKYAIAKLIEVLDQGSSVETELAAGDIREINIEKINEKGTGIIELENNYKLIIPNATPSLTTVKITRVKSNYAFGQVVNSLKSAPFSKNPESESNRDENNQSWAPPQGGDMLSIEDQGATPFKWGCRGVSPENKSVGALEGSKLTLTIPQNVKKYGKYLILKLNVPPLLKGFVFIKLDLKAKIGNKVRIKMTKVNKNFAIAKILQINPSSVIKKQKFVKYSVSQMLKNGVHLGEKASKCHAKMKNYIWARQHRKNKKGQHSINLLKTHRCLNKALDRLTKYAFKGRNFLFIGTKQVTAGLIARASLLTKTSFFVNTRWLGGMLTNWETISNSICKIHPILEEKQVIIREIVRQRIEIRAKVFKNLALCQKNILKKLTAKKNQPLLKNLENQQFTEFLSEQFQNRQQILNLINTLKQDKKSLKKLILEKEFENRLLASKAINSHAENNPRGVAGVAHKETGISPTTNEQLIIQENEKWIKLANSTRNHIKMILNFLFGKKNNSGHPQGGSEKSFSNKQFISLIKKKMNLIQGEYQTEENQQSDALITAEKHIKQIFKVLSAKKTLSAVNVKQVLLLKKLLTILPSLKRFFSISKTKLVKSVDIFMRKIIDLKFKRSFKLFFNLVYKNYIFSNSKKLAYSIKKKWQRLEKYLGGISNMIKFSRKAIYNNIAIIVGQKEEMNAVRECKKLGIEMFHIVDTNCNPSFADHIIPANDDSKSSIKYILTKLLVRIRLGQQLRKQIDSKNIKSLLRVPAV
jgi:small subunit ribosomal protein S2